MFNKTHFHSHDHSTSVRYPDTIKEVKAPTDESIRLLNEMQQKTLENIVAKISVKDNLIEGEVFMMDMR